MRIASLEAYNVPPQLLTLWQQTYGEELLPVQEKAVSQYGVLAGRNLIVQAPTSAGKTFVGEMAAVQMAMQGKKVLYLVPTKALAEDKFAYFNALYRPLGLRIIITTRDRRQEDARFCKGDFDIAIAIPEKVRSLWTRGGMSQFLGLAVIDELQILSDPERGPCLELLLAALRKMDNVQIVGLSASLGASARLADYLKAGWLESNERPIELRKGVLEGNCFRYVDTKGNWQEEYFEGLQWADIASEKDFAEAFVRVALYFAKRQEPTLIFVRDRATAIYVASQIAAHFDMRSIRGEKNNPQYAQNLLTEFEHTTVREKLQRMMPCGVAFHSADLQFEERQAVERAFLNGDVLVICCTPTLALGVNVPAQNVLVDPQSWQNETVGSPAALCPISRADFENRAGRAGRLGYGDFGRGILLARSSQEAEMLTARYLTKGFQPPAPALMNLGPLEAALTLAAGAAMQQTSLEDVYTQTFSAYLQNHTKMPASLEEAVSQCLARGLISHESTGFLPTVAGQTAVAAGIGFETFNWLMEWAQQKYALTNLEATFLVTLTKEAQEAANGICLSCRQDALQQLWRYACQQDQAGEGLQVLLSACQYDWRVREKAAWITLALYRWMGPETTLAVEKGLRVPAARLAYLGETIGWLLETFADLAAEAGRRKEDVERLRVHAECVARGLQPAELPLARLHCFGLGRDYIRLLFREGLKMPADIIAAGQERLKSLLPCFLAEQLWHAAHNASSAPTENTQMSVQQTNETKAGADSPSHATAASLGTQEPALCLSHEHPQYALFYGRRVPLRPLEFRLLWALAEKPGKCVSYDDLYEKMWDGNVIAEPAQIYAHRSRLCKKLGQAAPECLSQQIVATVPKHGLVLNLPPEAVKLA